MAAAFLQNMPSASSNAGYLQRQSFHRNQYVILENENTQQVLNVPGGAKNGTLVGVNLWQRVRGDNEQVWRVWPNGEGYYNFKPVAGQLGSRYGHCLNLDFAETFRQLSTYNCVPGDRLQGFSLECTRYHRRKCLMKLQSSDNPYGSIFALCLQARDKYGYYNGMPVVLATCDLNVASQWWRVRDVEPLW